MEDYRVKLDVYDGPLDLLLYLIQREEVDIHDIPISRITEQYCRYVELLKRLDPNLAGEFLVMAAALMEIKTRMLLPTPPTAEGGEDDLSIDPRSELVRQLLQYKEFKDAAGRLQTSASQHAQKFPRRPPPVKGDEQDVLDLEDAQVWDLMDAFERMMKSIGSRSGREEIIYDDTPVELHAEDILDRLRREGAMTFGGIFAGRGRLEMVGLFLALLELVRNKKVEALQEANFGEIQIRMRPPEDQDDAPEEV